MKVLIVIFISFIVAGCAGYNTNELIDRGALSENANYILFPFENPSLNGKIYSGVGSRLTHSFSRASSKYGYDLVQAPTRQFPTSKDLDLDSALEYGLMKGADYIIVGQVTKWVDRATEWNGKRDFAGVSITSYDVFTRKLVRSIDIEQHSNNFYSGTPNDFIKSLSEKAAKEFYQK